MDIATKTIAEELERRLASGVAILWPAAPRLEGVYAIDSVAVGCLAAAAALRHKSTTIAYCDMRGAGRHFTPAQLCALGGALYARRWVLMLVAAAREAGHDVAWPEPTATIA
jgi:hypothetical protein